MTQSSLLTAHCSLLKANTQELNREVIPVRVLSLESSKILARIGVHPFFLFRAAATDAPRLLQPGIPIETL